MAPIPPKFKRSAGQQQHPAAWPFPDQPTWHTLFLGTFVHSQTLEQLEYLHETCVAVSAPDGIIVAVEPCGGNDADANVVRRTMAKRLGWDEASVRVVDRRQAAKMKEGWFFPGFVDTHIHAPQYPNNGLFGKTDLLEWLSRYTYPTEEALTRSASEAARVLTRCVRQTLSHGTTTAAYYATIGVDTTNALAAICHATGQRAFVGRVCMNTDLSPPFYREDPADPDASVAATLACANFCRSLDPSGLAVMPIVTPRFAPSCTEEVMAKLGELAKREDLPVQTHQSENQGELALVKEKFPAAIDYADVYDRAGLLGPRTLLAHCIWLTPRERKVLRERGCSVAHCPVSNSALTSGDCPVRELQRAGLTIGLGTDVSGGYSPSVLLAARHALLVSRGVSLRSGDKTEKLSTDEVLGLATIGGAKALHRDTVIGRFAKGMRWDAQFIHVGTVGPDGKSGSADGCFTQSHGEAVHDDAGENLNHKGLLGQVDLFGKENWEEVVQKWLTNGDDRNTRMVWVNGRLVHEK